MRKEKLFYILQSSFASEDPGGFSDICAKVYWKNKSIDATVLVALISKGTNYWMVYLKKNKKKYVQKAYTDILTEMISKLNYMKLTENLFTFILVSFDWLRNYFQNTYS